MDQGHINGRPVLETTCQYKLSLVACGWNQCFFWTKRWIDVLELSVHILLACTWCPCCCYWLFKTWTIPIFINPSNPMKLVGEVAKFCVKCCNDSYCVLLEVLGVSLQRSEAVTGGLGESFHHPQVLMTLHLFQAWNFKEVIRRMSWSWKIWLLTCIFFSFFTHCTLGQCNVAYCSK